MINPQLSDYIRQQQQNGVAREQIKSSLIASGWQEQVIEDAFLELYSIPKATLLSAPNLFKQTITLYRQRFLVFLGIFIIQVLALTAFSVMPIFMGLWLISIFKITNLLLNIALLITVYLFFGILALTTRSWGEASLLFAIKNSQERIGILTAFQRGWRQIFSYTWLSLLTSLVILGGFIFFFIPGIIVAVWCSLAAPILIDQNLKGPAAIGKSREYVNKRWWAVFWRFLFIILLGFVFYILPKEIFEHFDLTTLAFIYQVAVGLLISPLITTYTFLLYKNLKATV